MDDGLNYGHRPAVFWRLAAKAFAYRMDRRLARGSDPGGSRLLVAHSLSITQLRHRRALAQSIRLVLAHAHRRVPPHPSRIRPWRPSVLNISPELEVLADRLERDAEVPARAVARLRVLLSDGTGPLYRPFGAVELRDRVRAILCEISAPRSTNGA